MIYAEDQTFLAVEPLHGFVDGLAAAARGDWLSHIEDTWVMPSLHGGDDKALARTALRILWAHCNHKDMDAVRTMAALGTYGTLPESL